MNTSWRRPGAYRGAAELLLTGVLGGIAVAVFISLATGLMSAYHGWDFRHYMDATRRWVETGTPYLANEVAGPFQFSELSFIHPPIALLLFVPFLVLPAALFWVIPLAGTAAIIAAWRPARWTWPIMVGLLIWPRFGGAVIVGNTDLWIALFLAAGLRYGWPALLLVIKPSIAPFALLELAALLRVDAVPRRRWTTIAIAAALLILLAVPFGRLWLEWLAVVRHSPADPLYSIGAVPWLLVPMTAWMGRRRGRRRSDVRPSSSSRHEDRNPARERERDRDKRRAQDEARLGVGRDAERGNEGDVPADLEHRRKQEDQAEDVERRRSDD